MSDSSEQDGFRKFIDLLKWGGGLVALIGVLEIFLDADTDYFGIPEQVLVGVGILIGCVGWFGDSLVSK